MRQSCTIFARLFAGATFLASAAFAHAEGTVVVYSAAIKKGQLDGDGYAEMVASTTQLNRVGGDLSADPHVHAITDVTGFGLLGHAFEMARESHMSLVIDARKVPLFSRANELAKSGFITGASKRNWASYGASIALPPGMPEWQRDLLADPQTSGGLLVACAPDHADAILKTVIDAGFTSAKIIGHAEAGRGGHQVGRRPVGGEDGTVAVDLGHHAPELERHRRIVGRTRGAGRRQAKRRGRSWASSQLLRAVPQP